MREIEQVLWFIYRLRLRGQQTIILADFSKKNLKTPEIYFQISQSRSLISVHWSPKNTKILLNMSELDLYNIARIQWNIGVFGLQCTEIEDRDCEILKVYLRDILLEVLFNCPKMLYLSPIYAKMLHLIEICNFLPPLLLYLKD